MNEDGDEGVVSEDATAKAFFPVKSS